MKSSTRLWLGLPALGAIFSLPLSSCKKAASPSEGSAAAATESIPAVSGVPGLTSGPLLQRAYVWQRTWSPQVSESVREHAGAFESLALLAGQLEWTEPLRRTDVRPAIDWTALRSTGKSVGLVLRVHHAGETGAVSKAVTQVLRDRLAEAQAVGVPVSEFQIDYDCPQKSLDAYLAWFVKVREGLLPTKIPLRVTALPTWLGEPAFAALADASDGYILQVHSFDMTRLGKTPTVCDPATASDWVLKAARLGKPFEVALPTYRCLAGYAPDGRYLGMAADAGTPSWPPGTKILEMDSDPEGIAALVADWTRQRPANLRGLYWYRLPVEGELRNWSWTTLAAVMAGRAPLSHLEVRASAGNPIDFTLRNSGEKDEPLPSLVKATWTGPERAVAADALSGWTCQSGVDMIEFQSPNNRIGSRLPPGHSLPLGWIRYHETPAAPVVFSFEMVR